MTPTSDGSSTFTTRPLGNTARALVREPSDAVCRQYRGQARAGAGLPRPICASSLDNAERVLAFMPARQGSVRLAARGPVAHGALRPARNAADR